VYVGDHVLLSVEFLVESLLINWAEDCLKEVGTDRDVMFTTPIVETARSVLRIENPISSVSSAVEGV